MSKRLFCVQPPSKKIFLATLHCFSVQLPFCFLSQKSQSRFEPCSLFQLFMLVLCCPPLPYTDRALASFSTSHGHNKKHVNSCLTAEYQCVPKRPLNTQITGLTHHCSCRVLLPVSASELLEFASSTLLFVRDVIFLSKLLLPNTVWPW